MKKVLDASGTGVLAPLVVSVSTTFVYDTEANTSRWPPGQEKLPADGGPAERLAMTRPFFASNEASPLTYVKGAMRGGARQSVTQL